MMKREKLGGKKRVNLRRLLWMRVALESASELERGLLVLSERRESARVVDMHLKMFDIDKNG